MIFKTHYIMKRVRIMLTVIGISATVGAAFAFKVKALGCDDYCTKEDSGNNTCTSFVTDGRFDNGSGTKWRYTITTNTISCSSAVCPSIGRPIGCI